MTSAASRAPWRSKMKAQRCRNRLCKAGVGHTLGCFVALLFVAGCSGAAWELGRIPDVSVLEKTLVFGQSTSEDVRSALGEPSGDGGIMMPLIDRESRQIWSYYYERGKVAAAGQGVSGDARRIMLFIYFDDGRYDGYHWYSTLPEHRPKS